MTRTCPRGPSPQLTPEVRLNRYDIALPLVGLAVVGAITVVHDPAHKSSARASHVVASSVTSVLPADDEIRTLQRASRSRRTPAPHVRHHVVKRQPSAGCTDWRASLGADEAWIYERESGMDPTPRDVNPSSGARGLGQLLNSTYRDLGIVPDWSPCHERDAARAYMRGRYHSWGNARSFWESHRWW